MKILCSIALLLGMNIACASPSQQIFNDIEQGNLARVEDAVKNGLDVNSSGEYGWTLLMHAANSRQLSIVKFLISKGANIDTKDKFSFTVVDILESNIRRAGRNRDKMIQGMRDDGLSEKTIRDMLGGARGEEKKLTEEDRKVLEEILDYINKARQSKNMKN